MDTTRTTTMLLHSLADPTCQWAWAEFDARYRPLLHAAARSAGLDDADAADVAQDTIAVFIKKYAEGNYDRDRARVRAWLCGIARLKIADLRRQRARYKQALVGLDDAAMPDEHTLTQAWDQARRSLLLTQALAKLRTNSRFSKATLDAFEMNALRNIAAEHVAASLGMTVHDVYMAKHRVTERLRAILEEIEKDHADDE